MRYTKLLCCSCARRLFVAVSRHSLPPSASSLVSERTWNTTAQGYRSIRPLFLPPPAFLFHVSAFHARRTWWSTVLMPSYHAQAETGCEHKNDTLRPHRPRSVPALIPQCSRRNQERLRTSGGRFFVGGSSDFALSGAPSCPALAVECSLARKREQNTGVPMRNAAHNV